LPPVAASAEAFAPRGWRVETQARGDLNADGAPDLAFVLTAEDAPARSGLAEPDPNPRWMKVPRQALVSLDEIGEGEELDPHGLDTRFPLACPERT